MRFFFDKSLDRFEHRRRGGVLEADHPVEIDLEHGGPRRVEDGLEFLELVVDVCGRAAQDHHPRGALGGGRRHL